MCFLRHISQSLVAGFIDASLASAYKGLEGATRGYKGLEGAGAGVTSPGCVSFILTPFTAHFSPSGCHAELLWKLRH